VLAFKSAVDSTVTTEAIVDDLLMRLPPHRNELVLFDINRNAAIKSTLLVADPAPFAYSDESGHLFRLKAATRSEGKRLGIPVNPATPSKGFATREWFC
jgi:hypothetical protein